MAGARRCDIKEAEMSLTAHSPAWYDRLATMQNGYRYPWRSQGTARYHRTRSLSYARARTCACANAS